MKMIWNCQFYHILHTRVINMHWPTRAMFRIRVEITSGMTLNNVGRNRQKILKNVQSFKSGSWKRYHQFRHIFVRGLQMSCASLIPALNSYISPTLHVKVYITMNAITGITEFFKFVESQRCYRWFYYPFFFHEKYKHSCALTCDVYA